MANEKTIQLLKPAYYDKFACIGGACEYDCCKEWNIFIDKSTYLRYKRLEDPEFAATLPERMRRIRGASANDRQYAQFVLRDNGACPFQLEDGLCEIHKKFGHGLLCETCQIYPRACGHMFENLREVSLIMSCPEAVRVGLFHPEPMTFQMADEALDSKNVLWRTYYRTPSAELMGGKVAAHAWTIREGCIDILQCRNMSIAARILAVGMLTKKITELGEEEKSDQIPSTVAAYVKAANAGELSDLLTETADNADFRAAMNSILMRTMLGHAVSGSRANAPFRDFLTQYIKLNDDKLELNAQDQEFFKKWFDVAQKRVQIYWPDFLEKRGYVLENYFVNYVFSSVFPFYFQEHLGPYHHSIILAEQYAIIRMLLCNIADEGEGIADQQVIRVLTSMSQNVQHNDEAKRIIELYQQVECDSLAHISFLLRDS